MLQIKIFWKQLAWPDVEGSYTFVAKIIDVSTKPKQMKLLPNKEFCNFYISHNIIITIKYSGLNMQLKWWNKKCVHSFGGNFFWSNHVVDW